MPIKYSRFTAFITNLEITVNNIEVPNIIAIAALIILLQFLQQQLFKKNIEKFFTHLNTRTAIESISPIKTTTAADIIRCITAMNRL